MRNENMTNPPKESPHEQGGCCGGQARATPENANRSGTGVQTPIEPAPLAARKSCCCGGD